MATIDQIVEAALAEFSEAGVRKTGVDDVARRLGLARSTIYRQVGAKDRLLQLVIEAEMRRAIDELDRVLSTHDGPAEAIGAGFAFLIRHVRGHPLFDRLLRRDADLLLPAMTINGGPVLAAYRSLIADRLTRWRDDGAIDPVDLDRAAEAIARLAMSLVLTPDGVVDTGDPDAVAAFAREILVPMLHIRA